MIRTETHQYTVDIGRLVVHRYPDASGHQFVYQRRARELDRNHGVLSAQDDGRLVEVRCPDGRWRELVSVDTRGVRTTITTHDVCDTD